MLLGPSLGLVTQHPLPGAAPIRAATIVPPGRNGSCPIEFAAAAGDAAALNRTPRVTQVHRAIALDAPAADHVPGTRSGAHRVSRESATTPLADLMTLTKPGIVRMVTITSAVGFAMAAAARDWLVYEIVWAAAVCIVGTALSAAGANTLNQALEHRRDGMMRRTSVRPIPAGRLTAQHAMVFGLGLSALGVFALWLGVGIVPAMVSLATIVSYVLIYTPLKPVTPLATIIGAIPGALPPLIGWSAASIGSVGGGAGEAAVVGGQWGAWGGAWGSLLHPGGWSLFLIIFVWQIPHFLAIAWKYRHDYERAGHMVLPVVDPGGGRTSATILIWSIALLPVSLAPILWMPGRVGWGYGIVATVAGAFMIRGGIRLAIERSDASARSLFIVSVIHLPVVLLAMVGDAALRLAF